MMSFWKRALARRGRGEPADAVPAASGEAGFTLLEAVIVAVIFSALVVSIYETVSVGQKASTEMTGRAQFEGAAREASQRLQREFYRARVVSVEAPPAAPAVVYQLPVDADGDGDTTDDFEQIEWGSPEPGNDQLGGQLRIEWRFDRLVSEAADSADYNLDGDRTDSFQLGRLFRVSAGGQELPIGPSALAVTSPTPGTPGALSTASPISASTSITCKGATPHSSRTFASSARTHDPPARWDGGGRSTVTCASTSWRRSLSGETTTAARPAADARFASVPSASSAS